MTCDKTKNLHAIQLLLGYAKLEGAIEYLSVEIEYALRISGCRDTEATSMQCPECENHFGGNWVEHECIEPNEEFNLPSCGAALRYAIDDGTY